MRKNQSLIVPAYKFSIIALMITLGYSKRVSVRNNLLHSVAAEVKHDFLFDTQMSLGRETSAEKSGL